MSQPSSDIPSAFNPSAELVPPSLDPDSDPGADPASDRRPTLKLRTNRAAFPASNVSAPVPAAPADRVLSAPPPMRRPAPAAAPTVAPVPAVDAAETHDDAGPLLKLFALAALAGSVYLGWTKEAHDNPEVAHLVGYVVGGCLIMPLLLTLATRASARFRTPRGQWKAFLLWNVIFAAASLNGLSSRPGSPSGSTSGSASGRALSLAPSSVWVPMADEKLVAQIRSGGMEPLEISYARQYRTYARVMQMITGGGGVRQERDAIGGFLAGLERTGRKIVSRREVTVAGLSGHEFKTTGQIGENLTYLLFSSNGWYMITFDSPDTLRADEDPVKSYLARLH